MKRWLVVVAVVAMAVACSDPEEVEPPESDVGNDIGEIDADTDDAGEDFDPFAGQLRRPVHVYTDEQGMPHIYAETLEDLFFANGYIQARDRMAQLEMYRRISTGTLSELLGSLDEQPIAMDTMFRMLGLERNARQFWEENYDPDQESFVVVESYAAGINAYIQALQEGEEEMHQLLGGFFPPREMREWKPWHTMAIARLLAVELTYYTPVYLDLTWMRQQALDVFDPESEDEAIAARSAFFNDVARLAPATDTTHIDGFPSALMEMPTAPHIDEELLRSAREMHRGLQEVPGFGDLTIDPFNSASNRMRGSNNWVVSGEHTDTGHPQVANDPHLGLSLPTVFYPMRLVLQDDVDGREDIDIVGASYVGAPGVVIGRNQQMAWGTTVGYYDYVDLYHEEIDGPGDGAEPATVSFNGDDVPVERVTEEIRVGQLGNINETIEYTVEIVPHHGPLMPSTDGARPVPRQESEGISVKWVGLEPGNEVEFLLGVWRAEEPEDVQEALTHYQLGSSNFVFGFSSGEIYYSGRSDIPIRPDEALTFHPVDNPRGNAPIFVLPGDGSAEWEGFLDDAHIPHALNPEKGYVITANNDPVGVTLDNDPFNVEHYIGAFFAVGFRGARIEERFDEFIDAGQPLTLEDHIAIQDDPHDGVAERVVPHLVEAIDTVLDDGIDDEAAPDLASIRDEIDGREAELAELRDLLDAWDFAAPASRQPSGDDVLRSSAATLFNVTMVYLFRNVLGDEMERLDLYHPNGVWMMPQASQILTRALVFLLDHPEEAYSYDEEVGDSLYFDDMDNDDVIETRLTMLVRSVLQARDRLADASTFGSRLGRDIEGPQSDDPDDWIWGNLHGLYLDGFFPGIEPALARPESGRPFFERPGGTFSVSPCGNGYLHFNFTCGSGSALRMVHDLSPDGPVTYNAIPGGASENPNSPHFDDQIERWNAAEPYRLIDDRDELEGSATHEVFGAE